MLAEFRKFIARGNVLDLAVAVIIGSAFATITKSLTDDIIMPVVGYIFGGVDFSGYFIVLGDIPPGFKGSPTNYAALKAAGVAMFGWGEFLTVVIRSEEHTSELQSLMRSPYAVFCLKKTKTI